MRVQARPHSCNPAGRPELLPSVPPQSPRGGRRDGPGMYVIVWEFKVKPGSIEEFEGAYGAAGDWAQFFSRGVGYLGTRLFRESEEQGSYVTFDRWTSRQDYENFQREYAKQYRELDAQFELM